MQSLKRPTKSKDETLWMDITIAASKQDKNLKQPVLGQISVQMSIKITIFNDRPEVLSCLLND